ncbi:MAG TPA: DNA polymerase III subunit beta [Mariprofundaceae bacterium]|nr:DNA polymerase III subunit beta [Mariprofundaceae bacterium]
MHITVPRTSFLQHVQRCQNIVEKRSTNAILSNLLLQSEGQSLKIVATDLQIGVSSTLKATIHSEGEVTVSAKKLFDIVKELDVDSDVELITEAAFMEIKSGRSKFRLSTLPAADYPGIPEQDTDFSIQIDGKDLATMIGATSFSMSTDETRKYLTGTLFEISSDHGLQLVATDGHRMALMGSKLGQSVEDCHAIVPRKAVAEIKKICDEVEGQVTLSLGKRQVRLDAAEHSLTSKVIDAQFPVYQDVIPPSNPEEAIVDRSRMDQILRRSMIVANEFTHDVRLQFSANGVHVSAHNTEQEQAEEFVDADYSGHEVGIGFNGRYLRDVLGAVNTDRVRIQFKDELSPVLMLEEGSDDSKYVVMPMRI